VGHSTDLVQAFENLIQNGITIALGGRLTVHLWLADGRGQLRVEDRGIGIPPEFREQLFLEFLRAPNARHHAAEGTGLGLALVREVALAHGGRVWLEERPAPGTSFRMAFPLRRTPPEVVKSLPAGYGAGYGPDTDADADTGA
jgi:two-component system sensor histidine kinase SenX3